jgi:photosystem II stability/assembly factor-like uncharacterized protein
MREKPMKISFFILSFILFSPVNSYASVQFKATNPNVSITLTTSNPPTVPSSGGSFDYKIAVSNEEPTPVTFDVWTYVILPEGEKHGPVIGPKNIHLPSGVSISRDTQQFIPAFAPPGDCAYHACVGIFPGEIWDSDSLTFQKMPVGGWYSQYSDVYKLLMDVHFVDAENGWTVCTLNTIMRTSNGGNNWHLQNNPPSAHYYAVQFVDTQTGWAAGTPAVHTTDGGETWEEQYGISHTVWDIHFMDALTGWAVGGREFQFPGGDPIRTIYKTEDGGESWVAQYYEYDEVPLHGVFFIDPDIGWAVGDAGAILHTTDGGNNWHPQVSGTLKHLRGVHFTDANNGWAVGVSGTLLYTEDGGNTWNVRDLGITQHLVSVVFVDPDTGWIAGGDVGTGLILHTTDGGDTWDAQESGTSNSLASIHFVDPNVGWAVGIYGTILHTTTGGSEMHSD